MENKINVAELLKDCPSGMELDCILFDDVHFDSVDEVCDIIKCYIKDSHHKIGISFNKYGCYTNISKSKYAIFPKGKTTWEGFVPPYQFKDGDVVACDCSDGNSQLFIFKEYNGDNDAVCYLFLDTDGTLDVDEFAWNINRLATEEEKAKLFDAIKANGYKWNAETKTLEKLVEPKFKVGDKTKMAETYKKNKVMNTGQDLMDFINSNNWLKNLPIEFTFMELLRRNIIKPSEIIDAHTRVLNDKCDRYKCHYEDSCVSAIQLFNGNFKGDDYENAKKRFLYNTSFSECFPNLIGTELTPEERSEWREFFKTVYGFDPEN